MDWIASFFRWVGSGFVWWVMVEPWEQAVRTRLGKWVRRLGPGPHLKLPFIDQVALHTTAWRTALVPTQTLSTMDGHTVVSGGTVGYKITDLERMYRELYHAEDTISQIAAAAVAQVVNTTNKADLTPAIVAERTAAIVETKLLEFGLGAIQMRLTDFAYVKAYRFVTDNRWLSGNPVPAVAGRPNRYY